MSGRMASSKSNSGQAGSHWQKWAQGPLMGSVQDCPTIRPSSPPPGPAMMAAVHILQHDIGASLEEWRVTDRHPGR